MENVGPLISALEELGIDPVEWARDPDMEVFWGEADRDDLMQKFFPEKKWLPEQQPDDINFACGYLQATSNLTNMAWAEQVLIGLGQEAELNKPEPGDCPKCGKYSMQQDRKPGGYTKCMECGYAARTVDWRRESNEKYGAGTKCSVCGEPQYETPSGVTCKNGHGGADPA